MAPIQKEHRRQHAFAWKCQHCSHKHGKEYYNRHYRKECHECNKAKPRNLEYYGGDGPGNPSPRHGERGERRHRQRKDERFPEDEVVPKEPAGKTPAAKAKETWQAARKACRDIGGDAHRAVVAAHAAWKAAEAEEKNAAPSADLVSLRAEVACLEKGCPSSPLLVELKAKLAKAEKAAGEPSGKLKNLEEQLRILKQFPPNCDDEAGLAEVAKLEADIAAARAAEGKSASDLLRSGEAKRAKCAKQREEARKELKDVEEAERQLASRRLRAEAEDRDTQQRLEEAELALVEIQRAVAHLDKGVHIEMSQVGAVAAAVATLETTVLGVRDAAGKMDSKALGKEEADSLYRQLDTLCSVASTVLGIMPPEMRKALITSMEATPLPNAPNPVAMETGTTASGTASHQTAAAGTSSLPAAPKTDA